jgi:Domain of unknown function (DUF4277)/Transposase IS66 family
VLDRVAQVIEPHDMAIATQGRHAVVYDIDETPWVLDRRLRWLWVRVSDPAALSMLHPHRSKEAFATLLNQLIPPHPAHGLPCGRGVEALVLAILDGHHALYQVGKQLEELGMLPLLQPELTRTALHDDRLGHLLATLCAAHLNQVLSVVALKALEV